MSKNMKSVETPVMVKASELQIGMRINVPGRVPQGISNIKSDSVTVTAWHMYGRERYHVDEMVETLQISFN